MKTAHLLFGLATACATSTSPEPQYPLCDRAGGPACGNIGQVGRAEQPVSTTLTVTRTPTPVLQAAAELPARIVPVTTRVILQASAALTTSNPLVRPLMNREEVVCGNVMTKGGSRRVCRQSGDAEGVMNVEEP